MTHSVRTFVRLSLVVIAAALVLQPSPASAAPIRFEFTATVDTIDGAWVGGVQIGDAVTGYYEFESTAVGIDYGTGYLIYGQAATSPWRMETASWSAFNAEPRGWYIGVSTEYDNYVVRGENDLRDGNWSAFMLQMYPTPAIASLELPLVPFAVNQTARVSYLLNNQDGFSARVESVTAVPEPSSILLLATGLAALGRRSWRRRRG